MAVEIKGVAHVNVNCSNLARSTHFYREVLELDVVAHTCPNDSQDGTSFGLPGNARWDAHMLCDHRGFAAPAPSSDSSTHGGGANRCWSCRTRAVPPGSSCIVG